jgi:F0F1-type ATP synthase assembly protein I
MNGREPDHRGSWGAVWQEGLSAMTLGWELALPIFGGVLLGHLLDRWLGTGHIFTLGLMVLGVTSGFYNLWRFAQRLRARQERAEAEEREEDEEP